MLSCFVGIGPRHVYPGVIAAAPTMASALLMHANADQGAIVARAMSNSALRYIGRISFSWYLWHGPLLVFTRLAIGDVASARWAAIVVGFALAGLTYRFLEQPFRHGRYFSKSLRHTYLLGAGLVLSGAGTGIAMRHVAPDMVRIGDGVFVSAATIRRDRPVIYADRAGLTTLNIAITVMARPCPTEQSSFSAIHMLAIDSRRSMLPPSLRGGLYLCASRLRADQSTSCNPSMRVAAIGLIRSARTGCQQPSSRSRLRSLNSSSWQARVTLCRSKPSGACCSDSTMREQQSSSEARPGIHRTVWPACAKRVPGPVRVAAQCPVGRR
jgi:hypothetical protein